MWKLSKYNLLNLFWLNPPHLNFYVIKKTTHLSPRIKLLNLSILNFVNGLMYLNFYLNLGKDGFPCSIYCFGQIVALFPFKPPFSIAWCCSNRDNWPFYWVCVLLSPFSFQSSPATEDLGFEKGGWEGIIGVDGSYVLF